MKHRLGLAFLLSITGIFSISSIARADISINTQSFHPALGPENIITVEGTRTPGPWQPMAAFYFDYAYRPLRLYSETAKSIVADTVHDIVTIHAMAGIGIGKWFSIGIDIPLVVYQNFDLEHTPAADLNPANVTNPGFGFGDLRFMAKFRIVNNQDGGIGFAFVPQITVPTGQDQQLRGNGSVGFDIRFALDYKFKSLGAIIALNVGFVAKTADQLAANIRISHEFRYALGAFVPFGKSGVGASLEFTGGTSVSNAEDLYSPFEMNVGLRYNHKKGFVAGVGYGLGFPVVAGSPQARIFAMIGYEKVKEPKKAVPTVTPVAPAQEPPVITEGDRDGDTVLDSVDKCPDVAGPVENQGCPFGDRDGDTVLDNVDKCPDVAGPVENQGCPMDTDRDGIPDIEDRCPYEPGPKENQGCPAPKKFIKVTEKRIELLQEIRFATNKSDIKPASFALLKEIGSVLKSRPSMTVRIEGHTDETGKLAWNMTLSQMRADSVMKYLIEKEGIEASRFTAAGFGPTVDSQKSAKLKETLQTAPASKRKGIIKQINDANRRTEFIVVQQ